MYATGNHRKVAEMFRSTKFLVDSEETVQIARQFASTMPQERAKDAKATQKSHGQAQSMNGRKTNCCVSAQKACWARAWLKTDDHVRTTFLSWLKATEADERNHVDVLQLGLFSRKTCPAVLVIEEISKHDGSIS